MDLIGIYLKEAIEEGVCPVCRILEKYENNLIEEILYEHVLDPEVDKSFKRSMGLCTYHAWKLKEVAYSNPLYGPLGVSMLYERVLSHYVTSLKEGDVGEEDECPLCLLGREKERNTIESIASRFDELFEVYKNSSALLCKKHFEMLYEYLREHDPPKAKRLKEVQIEKLESIDENLEKFISKFDYRSKEGPTDREEEAPLLAIYALRGSLIGANLHKVYKKRKRRLFRGGIFGD
ncbi:hypothetical protein A3L12_08015 [Thermococcus sp. P6]|uniref:DUF6062 family protein n=1 Tax=Thermococcus sp. P6 TaxID=122420 RepID=UPI000B60037B|nr:DUF6062 family protein [Thermococcus sp. P6]ASJ11241.1 hypothetical protein A3L12_08015 [Thermococcus sp. P6]